MTATLGAAFIANLPSNDVLFCPSTDGATWAHDNVTVNQFSKAPPAMVFFGFAFRLAFIANQPSNDILVCSSADGKTWTANAPIAPTPQYSKAAPSLAVFNNALWLAFVANDNSNGILICESPDGVHWTDNTPIGPQQQYSGLAPSMVAFKGKLWMAFIANSPSRDLLICSSLDGRTWSDSTPMGPQRQYSPLAPSLAVFQDKLWLAFVANLPSNDILLCSSADGATWSNSTPVSPVPQFSKAAPDLVVFQNTLNLAFIANLPSDDILICSSADGINWSDNRPMGQYSGSPPSLAEAAVITGRMRPVYEILTLVYAPPGTRGGNSKSFVDYGSASSTGSTTSISSSFSTGVDVSATVGSGIVSATSDFSLSDTVTHGSSVAIKKSTNFDLKVFGPDTDGIDHDEDQFILWLNPLLTVSVDLLGHGVQWALGIDGPSMIIQSVTVGQLKGTKPISPGLKQALTAAGLTQPDFATILKTNPFADPNFPHTFFDPDRFKRCTESFMYEPPDDSTNPVDQSTYKLESVTTKADQRTTKLSYGVKVKVDGNLADFVKVSTSGSMDWTNTWSSETDTSSSQSASVTIAGPSFGYAGPTYVNVYWDTVFSSFAFDFPRGPETASGTLLSSTGVPVAQKLVALEVLGLTFETFTDAHGNYRFYGAPTAQGMISVDGQQFTVAVGPTEPKATLRMK